MMKTVEKWLEGVLSTAPDQLNLFYVEWNETDRPERMCLIAFGFRFDGTFDPDDPDHMEVLSEPAWESSPIFVDGSETAVSDLMEKVRSRNIPLLRNRNCFGGYHDADVFPLFRSAKKRSSEIVYFEMHAHCLSNCIHETRLDNVDMTPFHENEPTKQDLDRCDYALILQNRARRMDLLFFNQMMICSTRLVALIREYTERCQIFDARLFKDKSERQRVDGYHVVNLYEKLDCITPEDLLPPPWEGSPTTFNPSKGYRLIGSVVQAKHIFRLNHEHYRLVVSQAFRDHFESQGMTGASWLKRRVLT